MRSFACADWMSFLRMTSRAEFVASAAASLYHSFSALHHVFAVVLLCCVYYRLDDTFELNFEKTFYHLGGFPDASIHHNTRHPFMMEIQSINSDIVTTEHNE